LIGAIYLDSTKDESPFRREDLPFMEAFANLAAVAIQNARAYRELRDLTDNLEHLVETRTEELRQEHQALGKAYHDLKEAQLQLVRSEKMAALGKLVAGITHEVNTPLGIMHSNANALVYGVEKLARGIREFQSEQSEESLKQIAQSSSVIEDLSNINKSACERISGFIGALKNYIRLDEADFKSVDIHEGLDSTLALIRHQHEGRITINRDYGEIPALRCRPAQMNQVFMNLLVNACEAIEGEGTISVDTRSASGQVIIRISDTGPGVTEEHLEEIFDPGFTTKGVGVGTGLGLPIARNIISDHQGQIEIQTAAGVGATVTVSLPVSTE
jgi:signal transduction histidine kinase